MKSPIMSSLLSVVGGTDVAGGADVALLGHDAWGFPASSNPRIPNPDMCSVHLHNSWLQFNAPNWLDI